MSTEPETVAKRLPVKRVLLYAGLVLLVVIGVIVIYALLIVFNA